jgi:hypothetical protein
MDNKELGLVASQTSAMKCPDCGIKIIALPCPRCESEAARLERDMQIITEEFSVVRGAPDTDESRASLDFALGRLHQRLQSGRLQGTVSYDIRYLFRSRHWWYISYGWIGWGGFIVSLDNGYVNCLGSGIPLRDCLWGHEHGIVCDLVDFTFSPDTSKALAARLLERFKHMHPNARGVLPREPVWYRESEIPDALSRQFPAFKRHFAWSALPELHRAFKEEGLRFTCSLAEQCI